MSDKKDEKNPVVLKKIFKYPLFFYNSNLVVVAYK